MTIDDLGPRANFSFSSAALAQMELIHRDYLRHSPDDPPVMAGISLGHPISQAGEFGPEAVTIGFWRRSEFPAIAREIVQRVAGIDLIFPVPPAEAAKFDGKVIDYAADRAFFLRAPTPTEQIHMPTGQ